MIDCIWPDRFGVPPRHVVLGTSLVPPFPPGSEIAVFSMGCFWGAERGFWTRQGIEVTAVGYTGGHSLDPDYHEVCGGESGHAEAVLVVADPHHVTFNDLLRIFWEGHDPTQGMRQGNDIGTQYRSGIHAVTAEQFQQAERSRANYQLALSRAGFPVVTTEIVPAGVFYYAEPYHQQYLAKNPSGYCGLGGTGILYRERTG